MTRRGTQNLGDHKQHRHRAAQRRQQRTESRTVADRRHQARRTGRPLVEEAPMPLVVVGMYVFWVVLVCV